MRRLVFAFAALCFFVGNTANAAIIVTAEGAPANTAGLTAYTVSAQSDVGAIRGATMTFTGDLSQVFVAGVIKTPFNDFNAALGAAAGDDTQFLFTSSQVLNLEVDEDTTMLTGSLTQLAGFNGPDFSIPLAQIVVPDGTSFDYSIAFDEAGEKVEVSGTLPGGPSVGIEGMYMGPGTSLSEGLQGAFASRGYGPIVLSDAIMISNIGGELADLDPLTVDVLGAPDFATVSVDDLDGDGKYDITIDADFASLDPGTTISGEIVFATGAEGADPNAVGFGFSVSVPEPSTIALSGLALLGLVGFARRRSC